jgi:hypothetical protein
MNALTKEASVLSTEELYEEIDRTLAGERIDFAVYDEMREFHYQGVPAAAKVITDDAGPFLLVGAVALCEVQTDREGIRDEIAACLVELREERPDLRFQFFGEDKVVWVFREIEIEDFTVDLFLFEVDEVTTPAPDMGRELRDRLGTGVPGCERTFTRRERSAERKPAGRATGRQKISNELFAHWLNHVLSPPRQPTDPARGPASEPQTSNDTSPEDVDEDIKEARRELGID